MKHAAGVIAISLLALGLTVPAIATSVPIVNANFTANGNGPNSCTAGAGVTGWTCPVFGSETQDPGTSIFSGGVPGGGDAACVGCNSGGVIDSFNQTLTTALLADTTYTLDVYVGWDKLFNAPAEPFTISLLANGTTLASDSSRTLVKDSFVMDQIIFNSGASPAQLGQDLAIKLAGNGNAGGAVTVWFANVSLDASPTVVGGTPEPGTWILMAPGLALAGWAKRRIRVSA